MQGGGIVVPCTYILCDKKIDRPRIRCKLRKDYTRKRALEQETGTEPVGKCKRQQAKSMCLEGTPFLHHNNFSYSSSKGLDLTSAPRQAECDVNG